jgi:hypothetical protein
MYSDSEMTLEDRRALEVQGLLELTLGGKLARFYCGWYCDDADAGFVTSEKDPEILVAWLEQAIKVAAAIKSATFCG